MLDVGRAVPETRIPVRPALRGRERELTALLDGVVPPWHSSVVVVEGAAGLGRTRLVEEVAAMATAAGVRVGAGRAWPGDDAADMAVLLDAIFGGPAPLVDPALLPGLPPRPDQRYSLIHELASLLAQAARVAPVLIGLDDLEWADPATLAALRVLPDRLGQSRIGWLLTCRVGGEPAAVSATTDRLRELGGRRVTLGPLGGLDVAGVAADIVRAAPSEALLRLVAGASGSPRLVVDLVTGLLEEGLVVVGAGRAEIVEPRLPHRLHDRVRRTLDRVSPPARRLAAAAAVLGPRVSEDQLASVLGQRPGTLFEPVDELIRADVLAADGGELAFRSKLVQRVVVESVPVPARRLLRRGAAGVLRAHRTATEDGDGGLDHRRRARGLAARAVDLATAGRRNEAAAVVRDAASAVAVSGDKGDAFVLDLARSQLSYMDGAYASALGRLTAAAVADEPEGIIDAERADAAAMWRSELLAVTDGLDEAIALAVASTASAPQMAQAARASRDRPGRLYAAWRALHGRHLLRAGRLAEAAHVLQAATGPPSAAPATVLGAAALVARCRVALHTVDYDTAQACARSAARMPGDSVPEARRQAAWLLAVHAMATGEMPGVRRHLTRPAPGEVQFALPRLMSDPADVPVVIRLALATGDDGLARRALAEADRRRRLNPGVRTIAAVAAHARGLWRSDTGELALAATLLAGGCRPLPQASALEDLGRELVRRGRTDPGARALGSALELYAGAGAIWDAGRVRRRLRALGVRRRLARTPGAASGWAGLTASELAVVRLVAQGLTNRAVAARLFVSPHTVSTHLRHVFAKLGINSRVELTRIVLANDGDGCG